MGVVEALNPLIKTKIHYAIHLILYVCFKIPGEALIYMMIPLLLWEDSNPFLFLDSLKRFVSLTLLFGNRESIKEKEVFKLNHRVFTDIC